MTDMENPTGAGLNETGSGRLDGLIKDSVREDEYHREVEAGDLAYRAARESVASYAHRARLSEEEEAELLDALGLSMERHPLTKEEKEQLVHCLPKSIVMDTRSPTNNLMPERKFAGRGTWS